MRAFMDFVGRTRGLDLDTYDDLWSWSVRELEDFWAAVWEFFGLGDAGDYETVLVDRVMPGARWFPGARISQIHGQAQTFDGLTVIPMYHPAAALRNGSLRAVMTQDFAQIPALLTGTPGA